MSYLQIIMELVALLQRYGPEGQAILAGAEAAFKAGGWSALAAYLAGVIANPPAPASASLHAELRGLHAKMLAA